MAKRPKNHPSQEFPGLFDSFELDMRRNDIPVFPDIARHAERVLLNGGEAADKNIHEPSALTEPIAPQTPPDKITFMSLGSGSSGNCSYIGDSESGFLIDAGVDYRNVIERLRLNGIDINAVKGICLTHDHGDHIRYAYAMVRKYRHISVYCTPKTLSGILRRHNVSRRLKDYHTPIYKEFPFKIGNFTITAFEVLHDGTDNSGFFIEHGEQRFAIATDLGSISPRVDFYMRQADYIMLESNYDATMLRNGLYPEYLKSRILADNGHLDNTDAARFLSTIYTPMLKYVFLCHLSNDNNTPDTAVSTVTSALTALGISVGDGSGSIESRSANIQLTALPRYDSSPLYVLRKG
ncbi:MAG: MBL fold metallo-hydrolase [Muribaculaceae bacterium]|nr:MBL fold metallo-hydrolase [Muribaculaceae bacterium]